MSQVRSRLRDHAATTALRVIYGRRKVTATERIGGDYGAWTVPLGVESTWVCYTVGVGEEAALDVALAERGCRVVAIDPTPRSAVYIAPIVEQHETLTYLPYALSSGDETLRFYAPQDDAHVSFSAVNRQGTPEERAIDVEGRTLLTIMSELGHREVGLLKLDIEGSEYDVLPGLDLAGAGVRVLCVEFHNDHGVRQMLRAIRAVERRGYTVANVYRTDVTFVRAVDV